MGAGDENTRQDQYRERENDEKIGGGGNETFQKRVAKQDVPISRYCRDSSAYRVLVGGSAYQSGIGGQNAVIIGGVHRVFRGTFVEREEASRDVSC